MKKRCRDDIFVSGNLLLRHAPERNLETVLN